jgi:signal transduction histidine kinase/ActR/RegA family two-component response regulator
MEEETMPVSGDGPDNVADLHARLAEAEETLRAIRQGEVDALLIVDGAGERVYTLRSADAPYRALVEQMQEGAAALNTAGDIIYCNRRFAELVDTPMQQVIGGSIDRFVDVADRATLGLLLSHGTGKLRTRLRHRDASVIDAHISVSQVTLDEVEHRTLIVTDLSTLTRVQRESRSKDEFLAMLAHELRNPLGAIGGAAQILGLADLREPRAIRAREVIQRQVQHMARLVDDLLDVGRVVTGKIVLNPQPVDMAESVRGCVSALTSTEHAEGRVEIVVEPVWVNADVVRLEQIVSNLVSNALKFTPPDREVRVSVGKEGGSAVLRVTDQGIGIGPDLLPHIFDLFVQADVTRDRTRGGLGIGLTLVRRLVELHGGAIDAASLGPGQGATFTVRLPAIRARATAPEQERVPVRRPARRVLLVDDLADVREMYALVLQAEGHDVHQATDGPSALAAFDRVVPDVVIIDIGLPIMDGYEVARRLRAQAAGRELTLIAMTGYGFPEDRVRSSEAGFDGHLVKPAAPEDLRRALAQPHAHARTA